MMEFPYECAEQTFNRFYANAIGTRIVSGSPRMRQTFETWRNKDTTGLQSNLQKNEELKSVLLQETPWMIDAQDESKQKRNIGILFSEERMKNELQSAISKLQNLQLSNGGFPWFAEGQDDRFITQYILTGIGRLKKMDAIPATVQVKINEMTKLAIAYLDTRIKEDYDAIRLKKVRTSSMPEIGDIQMNYLYMRSFFSNIPIASTSQTAVEYFASQEKKYWINQGKFAQGMIALTLFRNGDRQTAREILASLKQNAIVNSTEGMYWKTVTPGIYWYQAPVETESLLIEAFQEINQDAKSVDQMKTWLLNQKQTRNWKTTKATADACYALLMQGSDWLNQEQNVQISTGDGQLINSSNDSKTGIGYNKKRFEGSQVQSSMGNLTVSVSGKGTSPSWGAVYWQYFEDLDKISAPAKSKSLLSIAKKVFLEKNSDRGPVLVPIEDKGNLKIGDKIKIRIEIRSDR
ncbi:MAG TPA: alpha-2-macroglobulin, partial [Puia sp.]|nr:alpha-2-macroglobulin [Puia sp.]